MLYTEEYMYDNVINPFDILNEAIYLTIDESTITNDMIPIIQNNRLNTYLIESTYNYIPSNTTVILDEADVIEDPTIINEYNDYVIRPLSKYNSQYIFVETCCYFWLQEAFDPKKYNRSSNNHWDNQNILVQAIYNNPYNHSIQKVDPTNTSDTNIKKYLLPLEALIGPIDINKLDKQKLIKHMKYNQGWIGNSSDGSIAQLLGYSTKKSAPIPPFLQQFILSQNSSASTPQTPVQPQQNQSYQNTKQQEVAKKDNSKLHFSISPIIKRKYNINPRDKNAKITERQKMQDAINDLKELFGDKFDEKKLDSRKLYNALNKHKHVSNFSDETIYNILGDNPFESEYNGEQAPWELKKEKQQSTQTNISTISSNNVDNSSSTPEIRHVNNQTFIQKSKNYILNNKKKIGVGVALGLGAVGLYKYVSYKLDQKPKSFIAQRIAALRRIYFNWMNKALKVKNYNISNTLRKAASIILQVIDMLLEKLQSVTENIYRKSHNIKRRNSYAV